MNLEFLLDEIFNLLIGYPFKGDYIQEDEAREIVEKIKRIAIA